MFSGCAIVFLISLTATLKALTKKAKKLHFAYGFWILIITLYMGHAVPVAVFVLGVAAGLEVMSCRMLFIMSVISLGVVIASYGEISISWIGVVYQMGGVVGEALRLIFMEIFVKRKGLKLNPISFMYYVSPCRYVYFHKAEFWHSFIILCFEPNSVVYFLLG